MESNQSQSEVEQFGEPTGPPPEQESLGEIALEYWHLLREYYWVFLLTCLVGTVGAYVFTQYQEEIYQAESEIVFHKGDDNVFGGQIEQVDLMQTGGHFGFEQFWTTQKEVLESRWFAERVVKEAGLLGNDVFLPPPEEGGEITEREREMIEAARSATESLSYLDVVVNQMGEERKERLASLVEESLSDKRSQAIADLVKEAHGDLTANAASMIQGSTRIWRPEESRVGVITVKTTDPDLSATIANQMADSYIDYTEEFQSSGLNRITNWFDSYVKGKREELEEAQKQLQSFKQENNILSFSYEDRRNLTGSSMEQVNQQLLTVRDELAAKEALLSQIREIEKDEANEESIADMVKNETLDQLFAKEAELESDLAELETRYMERHPKVQSKRNQLEVLRKNIDSEIKRLKRSVENEVGVLQKNEKSLEKQLGSLKERIFQLNELGVEYTQLKDRVENLKDLYNTVLKRSSELDINSLYERNDIEVLQHARAPESPVSPSLPMNLVAGFLAGIVLGGGLTVVFDSLDDTIRSEADVEEYTDKPILAMLPELTEGVLRGLETIGESPADTIVHTAPKSSFAEAIKTLRTNLTFMSPDEPPTSMLVTSPGPGEGKTLASTNTAIAMAQSGLETLLVDTDLRKPRLHRAVDREKEPGITDIIRGDREPGETIHSEVFENLDVLTAGKVPPNPSELLHSERFEEVVDELAAEYDRVIYDSPPLAAVSDALILSQAVDGVLLILEFGQTRRAMFERSLEQLHGIGAPLLGCVINEIDTSGGRYGYDYSYYRYSYYGDEEDRPRRESGDEKLAS